MVTGCERLLRVRTWGQEQTGRGGPPRSRFRCCSAPCKRVRPSVRDPSVWGRPCVPLRHWPLSPFGEWAALHSHRPGGGRSLPVADPHRNHHVAVCRGPHGPRLLVPPATGPASRCLPGGSRPPRSCSNPTSTRPRQRSAGAQGGRGRRRPPRGPFMLGWRASHPRTPTPLAAPRGGSPVGPRARTLRSSSNGVPHPLSVLR